MFFDQLDNYTVRDIMSTDVLKIHHRSSRMEAIRKMLEHNVEEIIIYNDEEKVVGVLTFKDIMRPVKFERDLEIQLESHEVQEVLDISEGAKAIEARNLMRREKIGRLPVTKNDEVIGIVRTKDILDKVYSKIDEMHEALGHIIHNLHEGVCVVDKDGIVMLWSDTAEKLYRVKSKELLGKKLESFFPTALLLTVLKSEKPIRNVYHSPRDKSYAIISAVPIYINGELVAAVSTDRDITETANLSVELETTKEKLDYLQMEVNKINENQYSFDKVLGKSQVIKEKIDKAKQVASTNSSVLIGGESGTGKEVFARAIHQVSGRKGPFVAINCSAIPENLFESEIFGYEGGAFTGALNKGKIGKVELAENGTLFLDEIGDMPLYMQAKLLRVLQEKQIVRVGGEKPVDVDVRIISATHRNLKTMVMEGKFREDLFYRLNVVNIQLPSLKYRVEDIHIFLNQFMAEFCKENNLSIPKISMEVFHTLMNYDWPGNIRELKNTVEHLVVFSKNGEIIMSSIPEHILEKIGDSQYVDTPENYDLQENIKHIETVTIRKAMEVVNGNKMQAAKLLNIPRSTLYYKIKFYNIKEYL
ncbi:sigma54 specific transcriptional regulator, Fis family [Alkaliphilus metalliredigens QYMF]|uniref:Sigma54 specific transcriptional regulator, Fis family n=1 Tax=Alkaliphilus metalliredigens (strain QYMF) TaxID=293826 RepID=A6TL20_ALKMQ|nr:sigma-54 dependent transcriptional regulator PrdR [Alkaliphilus metalliredigens]ABR46888.1 sigma54 specific transcriptional regulator, Fis family [Alkaliphilus metalliredigens QYMF]